MGGKGDLENPIAEKDEKTIEGQVCDVKFTL